jgi:regulation of enolase protein 1 (concanavalin A-like superfamily)
MGTFPAGCVVFGTLLAVSLGVAPDDGPAPEFRDSFKGKLASGWSWIREDPKGWRVTDAGLQVRLQPGNMWGPANDAKNVLVRRAPDPAQGEIEISVTFANSPTEQWEQCDLVWYYDDGHMVKCGQELVDGKLSVVMGREEGDKTRTIKIVPLDSTTVSLRLIVKGDRVRGAFRMPDGQWQDVGECDLPVPAKQPRANPRLSLQFYQGPAKVERWARVSDFRVVQKR